MKKSICSVVGAVTLNKKEMKYVVGGYREIQDHIGDLTACNNKKCNTRSDCGTAFCASMTCKGLNEKHCM